MKSQEFIEKAKTIVQSYAIEHLDEFDRKNLTRVPDVYVVWYAYELGHNKAMLSTNLLDGMYYEVTYNSNKNEIYLDAYKKFENKCFPLNKE